MACYRAKILTSFKEKNDRPGILKCSIPSTQFEVSPTDSGNEHVIVPVVYTSPYSFHNEGGIIAIPPDNSTILVQLIGKIFYYLTTVVGPEPEDLDEISGDTAGGSIFNVAGEQVYTCETSNPGSFPDTMMIRHPKGHTINMKDNVPFENEDVKPPRKIHSSKIEMKSAGGKVVVLDDSVKVDAIFIGLDKEGPDHNERDGITIGKKSGVIGPRCIKLQAKRDIETKTDNGSILHKVVDGSDINIENTSTGNEAKFWDPKPKINLGCLLGDINLTAGTQMTDRDPVKAMLGASKIIIEALGLSRGLIEPPVIRIISDGTIEIIQDDPNIAFTPVGINIKAMGDINIESELGNVNIKGNIVNLNDPIHLAKPFKKGVPGTGWLPSSVPTDPWSPGLSLRGYVPFGWMGPFKPPI
jgi:hypothetical protein